MRYKTAVCEIQNRKIGAGCFIKAEGRPKPHGFPIATSGFPWVTWGPSGDEKLLAEVAQEVQPLAGVLSFQPGDLQRPGAKDVGYAWPIAVQCGRWGLESNNNGRGRWM